MPLRSRTLDQRIVVSVVYVSTMFLSSLDTTIVNVALPTLGREFKVPTSSIEWVTLGYLLSLAVWIPSAGWFGDRFGTKRVFLFALGMFTLASAACAAAPTLGALVAFRVLQGVGGGMLTPTGMTLLWRTFPPAERARAARLLVIPTVLGPASGPILGGLLVDHFSWSWIFIVNVPIGAAAFVFGWLYLNEHREERGASFDVAGFLLSGGGLALLLYFLSQGSVRGWTDGVILASGVSAVLALAVAVIVELRIAEPLLRLRLLTDRLFRSIIMVTLPSTASFLGLLFLVPLFLQQARHASALTSGLTTAPEAFGVLASSQTVARLYPRIGPRRMMAAGLTWAAACSFTLSFTDLHTSLWTFRLLMFLAGGGMACIFISMQTAAFATISPSDTGRASSIFATQRQMAGAIGIAILGTVLTSRLGTHPSPGSQLGAFRAAFRTSSAIALLGAFMALRIRDSDARSTMTAHTKHEPSQLIDA